MRTVVGEETSTWEMRSGESCREDVRASAPGQGPSSSTATTANLIQQDFPIDWEEKTTGLAGAGRCLGCLQR